ncbi:MAG: hypothetical protein HDR43_01840 [Mycoplasma sp.]|nr:hypothetical protein [Mycoplasma sp.]
MTIVGITIKHSITEPLKIEFGFIPNNVDQMFPNDCEANNPNITDGIPLSTWKIIITYFLYALYNLYLVNKATLIPIGTAKHNAINEVNNVILNGTQNEYLFWLDENSQLNKILEIPKFENPLIAYNKMKTTRAINIDIIHNENTRDNHIAVLLNIFCLFDIFII